MTSKSKVKRIRWMAALTLILMFMSLISPFLLPLIPPFLNEFNPVFETLSPTWKMIIVMIYVLVILFLNACIVVFFVRMLRGLGRGKIFVPGNARWLYIAAWLPIFMLSYRIFYVCFMEEAPV